ncbi:MAG: PAS domain S-box protein [Phycisphaeraceae bacterium]
MSEERFSLAWWLRVTAWVCVAFAAAIAMLALVGWETGNLALGAFLVPSGLPTRPGSALALLLLTITAAAIIPRPKSTWGWLLARLPAAGAAGLALLLLAGGRSGLGLYDLDGPLGIVSITSLALLLLLALGFWLMELPGRAGYWPAQICLMTAWWLALLPLIGYFYQSAMLYRMGGQVDVPANTALATLLLATAALFGRPEREPAQVLARDSIGGRLFRRLIPPAMGAIFVLGWLSLSGARRFGYDTAFAMGIVAVISGFILVMLIWFNARWLDRLDEERQSYAEALRSAQELYQSLVDTLPMGVFRKDDQSRVIFVNRWLSDFEGWSKREQWRKRTEPELFPPTIAFQHQETDRRVFESGHALNYTERRQRPDGSHRLLEIIKTPVTDAAGHVTGVQGIVQDVTERKQAEQDLRRMRLFLDSIIENLPLILFVKETDHFTYTLINRSAEELMGRPRDQVLGKTDYDIWSEQEAEFFRSVDEALLNEDSGSTEVEREHVYSPAKGRRTLHVRKVTLPDDRGKPGYVLGIAEDITERLKAEEERDRLFDLSLDMLCVASMEGRFVGVNPAFEKVLGYRPGELEGASFFDFVHPDDHEITRKELARLAEGEPTLDFENRYRHKSGEYRWISWRAAPPREGLTYAVGRDATAQKKQTQQLRQLAAALESSNRELEQFAYIASHDLQEPLRKVQGFGDMLARHLGENLDETGHDYLERMRNAAARMRVLINDLLTFSRVTTRGKAFQPVDLNQIARNVLSDLEVTIGDAEGTVHAEHLPVVQADPTQMRQLLQNLISNAIKFRKPDVPPVVTIRGETLNHGESCRIEVEDNGIGFDEKYLGRVFEPFQRLHGRSEYPGTGMGLAVCRKIVERHGGELTAHSQPGEGATFIFTLPCRSEKETERHE